LIVLSDYNTDCFEPIGKWLSDETDSYLDEHFQMISEQENLTKEAIKDRVRRSITAYTKCDLKDARILNLTYLKKVDLMISSLCVETVAETVE
jgi:hypothetical protein